MRKPTVRTWPLKVLALFFAFLFLFSSVMTGTYAWQSEQEALNNALGQRDILVPMELLKLERNADGQETEIPIADTVFYLYRENGTQIGGRYATDENGKINVSLAAGNYYFEEVTPSIGYTYDTDANGDTVKRYPFSVTGQEETVYVRAYNQRLLGDLLIRKTVENTGGEPISEEQRNQSFAFTVTFSDNGTYTYCIDSGEVQELQSGDSLCLKHGQTAVFENIPTGTMYTVEETPVAGYTVSGTGHRGNITEEQSVADFANYYESSEFGSIVISKEVVGEGADLNKEFIFIANIGERTEEFNLKHDETKVFDGIPVGTVFSVTEADDPSDDYFASVTTYSGTVTDTTEIRLPFVNVYNPVAEEKLGSLVVSKTVSGENADPDKVFTFQVTFAGENAPELQTFTLKAGESKTFAELPHGITYTVTETETAGYDSVMSEASGVIVGEHSSAVTWTNLVPDVSDEKVKLTVQKLLEGEVPESDKEREFAITLTVNGEETAFTLKGGEVKEFEIPYGASYSVTEENYIREGFSQFIINGTGTAVNDVTEAVIINTYVGEPYVEIAGQKHWELNGYDVDLPDSITVQLKNGDTLIEEKTVEPGEDGLWAYSFHAPKYNDDGTEAVYTVTEMQVTGFTATYEGYDITNHYVKPISVDPPIITKLVTGDEAPTEVFEFVFTGQHGTPMPEGSVGYRKNLMLNGAGELEIGTIEYDKAGTYVYTVHEKNLGAECWSYDTAVYTVTVVVTETDYVLSADVTIQKNGADSENIAFTNRFENKDDELIVISGVKTWVHGDNPENERPTYIVVEVYGDGRAVQQKVVTADENWSYSFTLPRYAEDGHEVVYTVDELDVENYTKQIDGYDLINTYSGTTDDPDDPTDPDDPDKPDSPQTGDNSNIAFWFAMMILSLFGLIATTLIGRRQKYAYRGKNLK